MRQEHLRNIAIIAHVDHGKTTLCDKLLRATDAFRANQEVVYLKGHRPMRQEHLRNIAIIAHVDHGKTTLCDKLLRATDAFRANQEVQDRILDSNDQERERGITILAKNISIEYKGTKINVIDTPGHADFGGEVERVLRMADGALLLVDAFEGPMPQTRFVLKNAIAAGLSIMVVVNKIDRPGARPEEVVNDVLDLMCDLGATDDQLAFSMEHVIFASAMNGYARLDPADDNNDMYPLLDMIVDEMPAPDVDVDAPLAMQVVNVDHDNFLGRIGVGRIYGGTIHKGDKIAVIKNDGTTSNAQVRQLFTFDYLGRKECTEAQAGDIAAVVGIDGTDIGDVYTSIDDPQHLPALHVDPPTLSIVFEASTSPLVGREDQNNIVGGRQLKERLMAEKEANITMAINELEDHTGIEVSGRGILHLSVLMETMRREGYEFQVGRPRVIYKKGDDGKTLEPYEEAVVETPAEYAGKIIEQFGYVGGIMTNMETYDDRANVKFKMTLEPYEEAVVETPAEYAGKIIEQFGYVGGIMTNMETYDDRANVKFKIPTRGLMGLKTRVLNVSHGEAVMYHTFLEYGPYAGDVNARKNGLMISMRGRHVPHVPRVRPLCRRRERPQERPHDLDDHREGRGLRPGHPAGARPALR